MNFEFVILCLMFGWVIGMTQSILIMKSMMKRLERFFGVLEDE